MCKSVNIFVFWSYQCCTGARAAAMLYLPLKTFHVFLFMFSVSYFQVSPQIDPNAPYTPLRRHQSRRCRTACALDPTQTQRPEIARKETEVHYTSLQFIKDKGRKLTRDGQTSSDDSSNDLTLKEIDPEESSPKARSAEKRRPPLVGHGIAGRTRGQRRRSQSGSNFNQFTDIDSVRYNDKENACVKENKRSYQTNETSSDEENRNLVFSNDNGTCSPILSTKINVNKSHRILRTRVEARISHTTDSSTSRTSQPRTDNDKSSSVPSLQTGHFKSPKKSSGSRSSKYKMNGLLSGESDCGEKEEGRQRRTTTGDVLAYDTPEAEYGITVSLRRRRRLLPTPAKNKLMMCL